MTFTPTIVHLYSIGNCYFCHPDDSVCASMRYLLDNVLPFVDASRPAYEQYHAIASILATSLTSVSCMRGESIATISDDLSSLYARKNHDYGNVWNDELDLFGILPFRIRIWEKLNRAITLLSAPDGQQVNDESVMDTITDICNYCVMTAMWLDEHSEDTSGSR